MRTALLACSLALCSAVSSQGIIINNQSQDTVTVRSDTDKQDIALISQRQQSFNFDKSIKVSRQYAHGKTWALTATNTQRVILVFWEDKLIKEPFAKEKRMVTTMAGSYMNDYKPQATEHVSAITIKPNNIAYTIVNDNTQAAQTFFFGLPHDS